MASGPQLTARSQSAEQEYLRLLAASSTKELEDRIVNSLTTALIEASPDSAIPVRLSMVADRFQVKPEPKLVRGHYDGELEFDPVDQRFVITLCTDHPELPLFKLPHQTRLRFTYAHELAHRFFYVRAGESWLRARDLATQTLRLADQMEQRITLGRLEERLCNKIAARVLIPDRYISDGCDLGAWFSDSRQFYLRLSSEARSLGVSRDCLLIRLRETASRCQMGPHVAFIVGRSAGPINKRAAFTLRVLTSLSPAEIGGQKLSVYPGMEVEKLGETAAKFFCSLIGMSSQEEGRVQVPICLGHKKKSMANLDGCWRVLNAQNRVNSSGDSRILLWGRLTLA
jgi:Zn-dependent peptidase ImmA (M78 family)